MLLSLPDILTSPHFQMVNFQLLYFYSVLACTAVEQAVDAHLSPIGPVVRYPVGTGFLHEDVSGFFSSPVRQMSGSFRPTFGRHNHPFIFVLFE